MIIILIGVGLALYYLPSLRNIFSDNSTQDSPVEKGGYTFVIEDTPTPTKTESSPTPSVSTTVGLSATVFIDANSNGKKEESEGVCLACFARALVCGQQVRNTLPKLSEIINIILGSKGELPTQYLQPGLKCWGAFEDRKVLIPEYTFVDGDISPEINIPASLITGNIMGVNSQITNITKTSSNDYIYIFNTLIPILSTRFTSNLPVYVKFMPDLTKPDSYFIKTVNILVDIDGAISGRKDTKYLKINWNFGEDYSTDKDINNYELVF